MTSLLFKAALSLLVLAPAATLLPLPRYKGRVAAVMLLAALASFNAALWSLTPLLAGPAAPTPNWFAALFTTASVWLVSNWLPPSYHDAAAKVTIAAIALIVLLSLWF